MVFFKHYTPTAVESCFEMYQQYKIGYWGIMQCVIFLISIILIITDILSYFASISNGDSGSVGGFFGHMTILFWIGILLLIPSFFPGGFGLYNIYRCGTTYLTFDLGKQEIYVIQGHYYNLKFQKEKVCPFTEFKGIAKLENKAEMLFLCHSHEQYATDSLLVKTPNEKYICFGGGNENGKLQVVFEGISKYWMENCIEYMDMTIDHEKESAIYFGLTQHFTKPLQTPNDYGTYTEVNITYDYRGINQDNTEILDVVDRRQSAIEQMKVIEREAADADGDSVVDEVGVERDIV